MESAGIAHRTPPPVGARSARARPASASAGPATERPGAAAAESTAERGLIRTARDYLALTKPRIISLLLWTTVMTMIVAKPQGLALSTVLWTCLGGYLSAGGAGRDQPLHRPQGRRPHGAHRRRGRSSPAGSSPSTA